MTDGGQKPSGCSRGENETVRKQERVANTLPTVPQSFDNDDGTDGTVQLQQTAAEKARKSLLRRTQQTEELLGR